MTGSPESGDEWDAGVFDEDDDSCNGGRGVVRSLL